MADNEDILEQEPDEGHPIILRSLGKCPKNYNFGDDFRAYVARFTMYANLNNIPHEQRAQLLFTLLDNKSFDVANNLGLHNLHEFNRVVERLISKFDPPAGELGSQLRLNSRKQLIHESLTDYFDALLLLARKTNLNEEAQHTKIIETVFTGAQDPAVRKKVIKFIAHAQDQQLTNQEKWFQFNALIKQITKLNALEAYTTTSQLLKDSETVAVLNNKLDNLLKAQEKLGNCSINAEKETLHRNNYQNEPRSQLSGYRNASGYSPRNNHS